MLCRVKICGRNSRSNPELQFHRFPKEPSVRQKWIEFCGVDEDYLVGSGSNEDGIKRGARMCSVSNYFKVFCLLYVLCLCNAL